MTCIIRCHSNRLFYTRHLAVFQQQITRVSDKYLRRMMSVPDHSPWQGVGPSLVNIDAVQNHSELFRAECMRLMQQVDKACKSTQDDDNRRLDQRVSDIQFLKKELELQLAEIIVEIDVLVALKSRVVKALAACKDPLRVTSLCLEERMKRFPSDRLHDNVERELLKEKEVIEGAASLLQCVLEQITEQIRLNQSAKYYLERDLKEKSVAQFIDNSCALSTTNTINNLQITNTELPSLTVTPKQWEKISDLNIAKAIHQKTNSVSLRAQVESVLEQTAADMQKQVQVTAAALQLNIQKIKSAKSQMEDKLTKILSEFADQQRIPEDLQVAITNSEQALSLAQARLALRQQRPGKEQCHDPAQSQLLSEVQQLTTHINKLHEAASQSEEEQRALVRCQLELQKSIEIKANSLYIDEVICTQHREPIIIHNF